MTQTMLANQVAHAAAGARPCAGTRVRAAYAPLGNASVGMSMSWQHVQFAEDITTKQPARHLGDHRTT